MQTEHQQTAHYSCAAIAVGALALCMALVHAFAGPFAPAQSIEVTIGEFAANVRSAAERAMAGQPQPVPVAAPWDIDRVLSVAAPAAGVLSLVLAAIGFVRRESKRAAVCGLAFGLGAITAQFFLWAVMVIAGAIIIFAILGSISEILGGFGA